MLYYALALVRGMEQLPKVRILKRPGLIRKAPDAETSPETPPS